MHTVINAATGDTVLSVATEAQFDRWHDAHPYWRAPRDITEVAPELRRACFNAPAETHYLVQD